MKLSEVKSILKSQSKIAFQLPNGDLVPRHFHVTEIGKVTKHFIDCGGTVRHQEVANFQLWNADDYDHRLHPEKLINIIELSQRVLELGDLDIEVEYQGETISKFGLEFENDNFQLVSMHTDCLARDKCGVPEIESTEAPQFDLMATGGNACTPGGGCC